MVQVRRDTVQMDLKKATNKQLKVIMNYDNDVPRELLKQVVNEMVDRGMIEHFILYCAKLFWKRIAKNKTQLGLEVSDVIQLGYMGILKALDRYEPGNLSFASFSRFYIKGEWQSFIRKFNTEKRMSERHKTSIDRAINAEGDSFGAFIPSKVSVERNVILKVHFESQMDLLTPIQKLIVLKHLQGYTTKELSLVTGKTRQNVEKHFYNALKKLGVEDYSLRGA